MILKKCYDLPINVKNLDEMIFKLHKMGEEEERRRSGEYEKYYKTILKAIYGLQHLLIAIKDGKPVTKTINTFECLCLFTYGTKAENWAKKTKHNSFGILYQQDNYLSVLQTALQFNIKYILLNDGDQFLIFGIEDFIRENKMSFDCNVIVTKEEADALVKNKVIEMPTIKFNDIKNVKPQEFVTLIYNTTWEMNYKQCVYLLQSIAVNLNGIDFLAYHDSIDSQETFFEPDKVKTICFFDNAIYDKERAILVVAGYSKTLNCSMQVRVFNKSKTVEVLLRNINVTDIIDEHTYDNFFNSIEIMAEINGAKVVGAEIYKQYIAEKEKTTDQDIELIKKTEDFLIRCGFGKSDI